MSSKNAEHLWERISLKSFLTLPYQCHTVSDIYGSSSQDLESVAPISPPGFYMLTTFPREVRGVTSIVCRSDPGPGQTSMALLS